MPKSTEKRIEELEKGGQDREVRLRLVEANLQEIKAAVAEMNENVKMLAVSMENKYAPVAQVTRLEQDMNKRFDELDDKVDKAQRNRTLQNITTILVTAVITSLAGIAVLEIMK